MKLRSLASLAFLCAAAATTLRAAPFDLPPLVEPPSTEHHAGKVIWLDLVTPDIESSKKFYGGLFGWTFRDIHSGKTDYTLASLGGQAVGGLVHRDVPKDGQRRPGWLTFFAVKDVDAATKSAVAHGAKVVSEARTYARRGRQAVLADPEGTIFAILSSTSGDPADEMADPGEWIWSSLLAENPGKVAAFYQDVFGYDAFDVPSDDDSDDVVLATDDFARASVNPYPGEARRHAHWLNFVRVVDAADAAAKAVKLGGRVLVEPHVDGNGGKVAVIADPAGATLGLMEWSETEDPKEAK